MTDTQQSLTEALGPWGGLLITSGCGLATEDGPGDQPQHLWSGAVVLLRLTGALWGQMFEGEGLSHPPAL